MAGYQFFHIEAYAREESKSKEHRQRKMQMALFQVKK